MTAIGDSALRTPPALLARVRGKQREDAWLLSVDHPLRIGRWDRSGPRPDVDLWPDPRVSRDHARLWYRDRRWWIEDRGSKHGTRVGGWQIKGLGPAPLEPGAEIEIGDSVLMLAPPRWHRLRGRDLVVDLVVSPAVNYALTHCGRPVVERLAARNWSEAATETARLTFTLAPFGASSEIVVPPIEPSASIELPPPRLAIPGEALTGLTERAKDQLIVQIDGQPLRGNPIECWVLPYNEWSADDQDRLSLAAFVLPNHPLVAEVALAVSNRAGVHASAEDLLARVYKHLSDDWHLEYLFEPPSFESRSQKLRLPHQVLEASRERRGGGTCIDLALLFAACLENLGQQPMVAVLDLGASWHALVGCWQAIRTREEPLIEHPRRLRDEALWIDPTGCTRKHPERSSFENAVGKARRLLREQSMVFALDVAAARQIGVTPLPFSGEPLPSAAVAEAVEAARTLAGDGVTGTVALLLGLLADESGLTRRVVTACLGDVGAAVAGLTAARRADPPTTDASYRHALSLARERAKEARAPWVREEHLLVALLEVRSGRLDRALQEAGIDRRHLIEALRTVQAGSAKEELQASTACEISSFF